MGVPLLMYGLFYFMDDPTKIDDDLGVYPYVEEYYMYIKRNLDWRILHCQVIGYTFQG